MRTFLVALVVLALLGVAGDRVAHQIVTDQAESRLAAEGLSEPTVDVGGFPFLDQLLRRRFDQVRVKATTLRTDRGQARDVRATARDVAAPSGGQVTVSRLSARGTVTYAEVLRQVGVEGLRLGSAGNGTVRLRRDVTVLGQRVTASAVGRVEPRGRRIRVVPTSVELADGSELAGELAAALGNQLSFTFRLRDLPRGVVVRRVVPEADGFVVSLSGADVSFPLGAGAATAGELTVPQ